MSTPPGPTVDDAGPTADEAGGSGGVDPEPARTFEPTFRSIADVQGWMTRAQACRLWDRAADLRPGTRIVEIGSFHGRSAIVLATAAPAEVEIITIDPHGGNDRGPQEFEGFQAEAEADHQTFRDNLAAAGVADRIRHLRLYSHDALAEVNGGIDLLYIDGAHRYRPALDDLVHWSPKVTLGGRMLVHDSFSAWGLTLALLQTMLWSGRFRYVGRSGSMAEYERVDLTPADRVTNALRQLMEGGYLARNLLIKVLIVARLGALTRLLGGDGNWPY